MTTITATYGKNASEFPNRPAIQIGQQTITYKQWNEIVEKTAGWLISLHEKTPTLGIYLPNGIPFLQLFAGAAKAGWTSVLFDPKWQVAEIDKRLSLSRPSILITTRRMAEKIRPFSGEILIWEECHISILQATPLIQEPNPALPFYMGFTSGTTGDPKAFVRSHASWTASFICNIYDFAMDGSESVLIPGALIHSHFLYGAISTLYLGGTVYLLEKFNPSLTLSILKEKSISTVFVVPTMVQAFLKQCKPISKQLTMISSGAKWEEASKLSIRRWFPNLTMYEYYGASELSFVTVLNNHEQELKPGSVGKPCYKVELQIRTKDNELAKVNEIGKIYVRSEMVFMGYLYQSNDSITIIADKEGWITVDDMGYFDEDGYLYLVGREKNMILYGGINIFPEEIEKVLSSHPDIDEVAVIGLTDEYWGQIVAAVVVGNTTKKGLVKHCKDELASFKIPRKWVFVEEMPHTISGKIARAELKQLIESEVKNDANRSHC
ncbi:AMP-binding protein [Bacillus sp. DNRA2]|uniref:AMP-binding protein n=1 Tax=Bacillus sp. DNRA2 TaxID=2723053 RepID=UPI00145C8B94|nr:AMP-binding protein [Bacillus sp. DNRA2]NMD70423.1 AMP-binding protein [Bacillus sp. DNRA2]